MIKKIVRFFFREKDNFKYGIICAFCGKQLTHPPIKIPGNVMKANDRPGFYDIDYHETCKKCSLKLLNRRFFGILSPKIILEEQNPVGVNRWNVQDTESKED